MSEDSPVVRRCAEAGSEEETGVCPRGSICKCLLSFTASLSQSGDPAVNFDQPWGPPSHFLHLQTSTRRQMDRQRQTSVNELTERIEAGYPRSAQRGWIRPTDVTEWGGAGNKTCFHPVFYFTLSLLTHSAFIRFTHLRCWIISVRANVFMHFSSCSGRFWKWCKIRMSINKIS